MTNRHVRIAVVAFE